MDSGRFRHRAGVGGVAGRAVPDAPLAGHALGAELWPGTPGMPQDEPSIKTILIECGPTCEMKDAMNGLPTHPLLLVCADLQYHLAPLLGRQHFFFFFFLSFFSFYCFPLGCQPQELSQNTQPFLGARGPCAVDASAVAHTTGGPTTTRFSCDQQGRSPLAARYSARIDTPRQEHHCAKPALKSSAGTRARLPVIHSLRTLSAHATNALFARQRPSVSASMLPTAVSRALSLSLRRRHRP